MSSTSLLFNPIAPPWLIIFPVIILFMYVIWREVMRRRRLLFWRILAQILVMVALLGLFLRPAYHASQTSGPFLLLTENYNKRIADSLVRKYPLLKVHGTGKATDFPGSTILTSLNPLNSHENNLGFVLGEGLSVDALDRIGEKNFNYFPASLPEGITELFLKEYQVHQKAVVSGEYNLQGGKIKLKLTGPAGSEDSVQLSGNGIQPFSLSFVPKQAGKFIYHVEVSGKSSPIVESLPLEVLPESKLNILFLLKYPTFEVRYLKDYLASRGHALWLRYQISKNLYRNEFDNRAPQNINHFTAESFNSADLLFVDIEMLRLLSPAELKSLELAVKSGLGVIFLFSKATDVKSLPAYFTFSAEQSGPDTVNLMLPADGKITLPSLPLHPDAESFVPLTVHGDRVLSGYQHKGSGKAGFQFLQETFALILKGHPDIYAQFWSPLLQQTARRKNDPFKIKIPRPFPWYANDPVPVEVISGDHRPVMLLDSIPVALMEDVTVDNLWHGKIWAAKAGWHELSIPSDSTHLSFYVAENGAWSSLSKAHQEQLNFLHHTATPPMDTTKAIQREIPPLWFLILFIVASGFLWLAPKL